MVPCIHIPYAVSQVMRATRCPAGAPLGATRRRLGRSWGMHSSRKAAATADPATMGGGAAWRQSGQSLSPASSHTPTASGWSGGEMSSGHSPSSMCDKSPRWRMLRTIQDAASLQSMVALRCRHPARKLAEWSTQLTAARCPPGSVAAARRGVGSGRGEVSAHAAATAGHHTSRCSLPASPLPHRPQCSYGEHEAQQSGPTCWGGGGAASKRARTGPAAGTCPGGTVQLHPPW